MRILALLLLLALPAKAGYVDASLLSSLSAARPGESFTAGLKLKLHEGWHVYWKNPGDAGTAPTLAWKLPPGWKASPLSWPVPQRLQFPPLTNFGYKDGVVLPLTLSIPPDARPGVPIALRARAEWLACRETCVPGAADLTLHMAIRNDSRQNAAADVELKTALLKVPQRADGEVSAERSGGVVRLRIKGQHPLAEFFPSEPDVLENARSPVSVSPLETEIALKLAQDAAFPSQVTGVVAMPDAAPVEVSVRVAAGDGLLRPIVLAFLGGLLLNLMPCVLPVLAFKTLGLLNRRDSGMRHGGFESLAYTLGMVLCCGIMAALLISARHAGETFGWGTQFQSPWIVGLLAALFALAGVSLLGFFEIGSRWMGVGSSLSMKEGLAGSFFSGVFAMAAGAPCTAPFMGAALGWALTRPAADIVCVFCALGLGAAAPFALLSSCPVLVRFLPKPGNWMITLKKLLSIPMFATSFWLLFVLWGLLSPASARRDSIWKPWSPEAVARGAGKRRYRGCGFYGCMVPFLSGQRTWRAVVAGGARRAFRERGFCLPRRLDRP